MGLCVAAAIWGFNFGISRLSMKSFPEEVFILLRFGLALPILFLILWIREGSILIRWKDAIWFMLLGFIGVTLLELMVMFSVKYTSLANASLLNVAPWPIFVALFSPLFIKEPITRNTIIGGLAAMAGVTLVIMSGQGGLKFTQDALLGDLAAFAVSIIGAMMSLTSMKLMLTYSPLRVTSWQILFGVLFLFPFTLQHWGKVSWDTLGINEWGMVGFNVIFCTVVAFLLWNGCMRVVGATVANFFRYVVPAAAVLAGYLMFDERITIGHGVGALMMGLGLIWISSGENIILYFTKSKL
jgi:drug/metabolite transporter (DMT)-like permease